MKLALIVMQTYHLVCNMDSFIGLVSLVFGVCMINHGKWVSIDIVESAFEFRMDKVYTNIAFYVNLMLFINNY